MPQVRTTRVKRVMAGPGAGKTSGLIEEILSQLYFLKPNKFFVVITYTNAATERIRAKISECIKIPPNLFIGTIHSFLDRFILIPYASNLGIVPADLIFTEEITIPDKRYKQLVVKQARDRGIITYSQIEFISEKIICGGKLKSGSTDVNLTKIASSYAILVSRRLQFIFVDEYQDATLQQHNIFKSLIKTQLIDYFYCVGDPEQYIYGFTYKDNSLKKPDFLNIPIHQIGSLPKIEAESISINRRSNNEIVGFLNNFSQIKQTSATSKTSEKKKIFFISYLDVQQIINKFNDICLEHCLNEKEKFFLSYAGKTTNGSGIIELDGNYSPSPEKILGEALRLICGISGLSQKEIKEGKDWDDINLRKAVLKVIKRIKTGGCIDESVIKSLLQSDLGIVIRANSNNNSKGLSNLIFALQGIANKPIDMRSTIHKSKGLEAHAVLVIAETEKRLNEWFETDYEKRKKSPSDECRIGFVAFSRARDLLCIACLEQAEKIKNKMPSFGVEII